MTKAGLVVICSFISAFRAERRMVRELTAPAAFLEIFVDTPLEECIRRDPKGLYAKAKALIQSSQQKLIAEHADWRFLDKAQAQA
jgi:adenylylsulfate kinase-like enzyme